MNEQKNVNKNSGVKHKIIIGIVVAILVIGVMVFGYISGDGDLFSSHNPNTTPSPTDNTISEEVLDSTENYVEIGAEKYLNNKVLTAFANSKDSLTVGVNCTDMQGIVLNPSYSRANADKKVGYYITDNPFGMLEYSETSSDNSANLIIDWTYDNVKSAEYKSNEEYGVRWSVGDIDNPTITKKNIKIVVVDMTNHNILSSFTVVIGRNKDGVFELTDLYDNDINAMPASRVKELWELNIKNEDENSEEYNSDVLPVETMIPYEAVDFTAYRQQLIDMALAEIASGRYITVDEPFNMSCTVELSDEIYHRSILTSSGGLAYQATFKNTYPIWVVTVNSIMPEIGHYTFYIDKELRRCFGCDYFWLENKNELDKFLNRIQ